MPTKEKLKYPLLLFLLILFAKIIYIIIESGYNYDILRLATSSTLSREKLEALNSRGHLIAATGFTLFIIPFLYFLARQSSQLYRWFLLAIYASVSFVIFYFSLGALVDIVVAKNQDKRYEAYYTNLVKYGMLNNVIHYHSFVDSSHLSSLNVNDRIIITNIFLLLYADEDLIDKFRKKGESNVIKLAAKKFKTGGFKEQYNRFKKMAKEIEIQWIEFNKRREMISQKLQILDDPKEIDKAYTQMKSRLKTQYINYKKAYSSLEQKVKDHTTLKQLNEIKRNLKKYFRYQQYKKAQTQYRQKMFESFGHSIEPKRWLDNQGKLTYLSIESVIKDEIQNKMVSSISGLKGGLSIKAFLNNIKIKSKVAEELKQYDILIPRDFDYSYSDFQKYYKIMTAKKSKNVIKLFYRELEKKIGKNDLRLDIKWKDFVYSSFLTRKITDQGIKNPKPIQEILESQELSNFNKKIYLPKAYAAARKKLIYEPQQFYDNKQVTKIGDESIKLLYIPPIALGLSILALLLNLITVFGMILEIIGTKKYVIHTIAIAIIATIIFIPFVGTIKKTKSNIIQKIKKPYLIKILRWDSYWVSMNYKFYQK